jgi:hypothetical protein
VTHPSDARARRATLDPRLAIGIAGLGVAVLLVLEFLVRLSFGPRPGLTDSAALVDFAARTSTPTIMITLIDAVMMALLIVFLTGFRRIVAEFHGDIDWITTIVLGAGLVFVAITLVGDSLEAGGALNTVGVAPAPDPGVIRALTEGYLMLFGPFGSVLIALIAAAAAYVTFASGALPRWTGWIACAVAGLNVAAIPTAFGGTDYTVFYSVGGWGVAVFATFPWLVWVIAVSVAALRERRSSERGSARARSRHPDRRTDASGAAVN